MIERLKHWKSNAIGLVVALAFFYLVHQGVVPIPENWMTQAGTLIPVVVALFYKPKTKSDGDKN